MLIMNEIHIKPYMNFKGGNIVGNAYNNFSLATFAYTCMISSITPSKKLFIFFHLPLCKMILFFIVSKQNETLFHCIEAIIRVGKIRYRVFGVLSENNAINGNAINNF